MGEDWGKVKIPKLCYILIYKYFISIYPLPHREREQNGENARGFLLSPLAVHEKNNCRKNHRTAPFLVG